MSAIACRAGARTADVHEAVKKRMAMEGHAHAGLGQAASVGLALVPERVGQGGGHVGRRQAGEAGRPQRGHARIVRRPGSGTYWSAYQSMLRSVSEKPVENARYDSVFAAMSMTG